MLLAERHSEASDWFHPAAGGTTPMFAGHASVITQAIAVAARRERRGDRLDIVVGQHEVSPADAPVTPGESGSANVATPEPAAAEQRVHMPGSSRRT